MVRKLWMATVLGVGAGLLLPAAVRAQGDDGGDLRSQVEQLRTQVQQQSAEMAQQAREIQALRQGQEQSWLNAQRSQEIKALIGEVLADADGRSSLAPDAGTAGWQNNFYLASGDGAFKLFLFGQIEQRYVHSSSENAQDLTGSPLAPADLDDDRGGFEGTRIRTGFRGNVVDPSWQYFLWLGFNSSGTGTLLDAYVRKDLGGGFYATIGQFKPPLWQEWLVSETRQQFIERSLISAQFNGSYVQGVNVGYRDSLVHAVLAVSDGLGNINTPISTETVEGVAVTGRGEFLLAGDWKQYLDFQGWRGDPMLVVLAAGAHWQQGEYGTSGGKVTTGDEVRILRWAADATWKMDGWSLFAAVLGNHQSDAVNTPDLDQFGVLVQGGVFVTPEIELMARYEWGDLDLAGVDDLSILTVGGNWFIAKHQVKFSADAGYSFGALTRVPVPSPAGANSSAVGWASEAAGWRPEAAGVDGQFVIRLQVQLLY